MGNFEKLSVLVIGVIIVMILVVALYTWTDNPGETVKTSADESALDHAATPPPVASAPSSQAPSSWADFRTDVPGKTPGTTSDPSSARAGGPADVLVPSLDPNLDPKASGTSGADKPHSDAPASDKPSGESATPAPERTYTVKPGQTLSVISQEVYGTSRFWKRIAERNGITDPARVRVGAKLIIPVVETTPRAAENKGTTHEVAHAAGAPKPGQKYTVRAGDTIQKIAQSAYGTIERWPDIWFANMERIDNPREMRAGVTLVIPQ